MMRCFGNSKKYIVALAVFFVLCAVFVGSGCALSGSGTSSDPYTINTMADLQLLSGDGYLPYIGTDKYFVLGADINFGGANLEPIGTEETPFNGHFNGKEHTISNIYFTDRSSSVGILGMFTKLGSGAEVKNFGFKDCTLYSSGSYCGFLAGKMDSYGVTVSSILIENCMGSCSSYLGGVLGVGNVNPKSSNTVEKCIVIDSSLSVTGVGVGGIVGIGALGGNSLVSGLSVDNCMVMSTYLSGSGQVGGLVGSATDGKATVNISSGGLDACYLVSGNGDSVGGIIGDGRSTEGNTVITTCVVNDCYLKSGSSGYSGGIVGSVKSGNCQLKYCESTLNTVVSSGSAGGLIGFGYSSSVSADNCKVNNNCISGATAGGVSGDSNVSVTGGEQSSNNVYGSSAGTDIAGCSGQTKDASVFVTFTGLSMSYDADSKTATFTIDGQRGSSVMLNGKKVSYLYTWQYENPVNSTETTNSSLEHVYSSIGAYQPKLTLKNESQTTGVTNVCSSSLSNNTIVIDEGIKVEPASANTGATVAVSITAHTTASGLSYQWFYSSDSGTTWQLLNSSTEKAEFVPMATGTYHFKCILTDSVGKVDTWDSDKSSFVMVGVGGSPVITSLTVSPSSGGSSTEFTLECLATGTSALTYEYFYSLNNGSSWLGCRLTDSSLSGKSVQKVAFTNVGTYLIKCVVTDSYSQSTDSFTNYTMFNNVTCTVGESPEFLSVSVSPQSGGLSQNLTFSSASVGATSYIWEMSDNGGTSWVKVHEGDTPDFSQQFSFQTIGTYHFRIGGVLNGNTFYCNPSQYATYTAMSIPVINSVSCNPTQGNQSASITLVSDVTGTVVSYQWQISYDNVTWSDISGATSPMYNGVFELQKEGNVYFRLIVSDGTNSVTSQSCVYVATYVETGAMSTTVALAVFGVCFVVYLIGLFIMVRGGGIGLVLMILTAIVNLVVSALCLVGKVGNTVTSLQNVSGMYLENSVFTPCASWIGAVLLVVSGLMAVFVILIISRLISARRDIEGEYE